MDTNVTTAPDLDERAGTPLGSPIRLPGGRGTLPHSGDTEAGDEGAAGGESHRAPETSAEKAQPENQAASAPRKTTRRKRLLATTAVVVVMAGIGGVAWTQRQRVAALPFQTAVAELHHAASGLLGTAAAPKDRQTASEVGLSATGSKSATVAVSPLSADAQREIQAALQRAEFASLKPGGASSEVGAKIVAVTPVKQPPMHQEQVASAASETGSAPATPAAVSQLAGDARLAAPGIAAPIVAPPAALPVVSATPPVPAPSPELGQAGQPATTPAAQLKSRDPIQTAADLRAMPLAPRQQVEVVGLVRELGAQLKETRLTVGQLSVTVAELKAQLEARTDEFDGRLSFAEAGTVLAESAKAGTVRPPTSAPQTAPLRPTPARPATGGRAAVEPIVPAAAVTGARTVKDFRVQGASPGLVVLNALASAPGDTPVLYLALGDQVPGLGRIKSIYQRGTSWVVQTDSGLIQ